jgi:hypothetical protein
LFDSLFGAQPAVIVADENTYNAASRDVAENFQSGGVWILSVNW